MKKIWPHMFYHNDLGRWKMNVARAMGNTRDASYVPDLIRAFGENEDPAVKSMAAWALGQIGGDDARKGLQSTLQSEVDDNVRAEILLALEMG